MSGLLDHHPAPGDPEAVRQSGRSLGQAADDIADVRRRLRRSLDDSSGRWTGPASDAFREYVEPLQEALAKCIDAFSAAERTLKHHARRLDQLQHRVDELERHAQGAHNRIADAQQDLQYAEWRAASIASQDELSWLDRRQLERELTGPARDRLKLAEDDLRAARDAARDVEADHESLVRETVRSLGEVQKLGIHLSAAERFGTWVKAFNDAMQTDEVRALLVAGALLSIIATGGASTALAGAMFSTSALDVAGKHFRRYGLDQEIGTSDTSLWIETAFVAVDTGAFAAKRAAVKRAGKLATSVSGVTGPVPMHRVDDIADTYQSLNNAIALKRIGDAKQAADAVRTTIDLAPRAVTGDLRIELVDVWFDEFVDSPRPSGHIAPQLEVTPLRDRSPLDSESLLSGIELARRFTAPVPGPVVVPVALAEAYSAGVLSQ